MENKMKILLAFILCSYSLMTLGAGEIWLQDIDCKIIGSNTSEVISKNGSLITSICIKNSNSITCSNTAKDGNMYGEKPSAITTYQIFLEDKEYAIWEASSHLGTIILNFKNKRYSLTSTYILPSGIFNKNCVGEIKNY